MSNDAANYAKNDGCKNCDKKKISTFNFTIKKFLLHTYAKTSFWE